MSTDSNKAIATKQLDILKTQLSKQIEGFKQRRKQNQRNATIAKALTIIFGFGITVLLGLSVNDGLKPIFTNIALVLGASVTMLAAWDAFANYRAFWFRYTFTYTQLLSLRSEIEFEFPENSENISEANVKKLYRKYQTILEETNEYWRDMRKEESSKPLA
ncbi:MAG: DUF4231 domain-containing protein [Chloroflexota bacterium]